MTGPASHRRSRVWLAVAVGAAAIVVLAGVTVLRPPAATETAPRSQSASDAAAGGTGTGPGLVAAGPLGSVQIPARDPVPWSEVEWREVPRAFGAKPDRALDRVDGLIADESGLIGWGRISQPGRNQFNDMGAVYLSTDGLGWTVVPIDDGVGRRDGSEIHVVAGGPLGVLVVGGVCCTDEERPAVWRSTEGGAWARLPLPEAFVADPEIASLIGTDSGYLAGGAADGSAAVWWSPDGAEWTRIDDAAAGFGPGGIRDMRRTADGVVAVGWQDVGGTSDGAVWTSTNGVDWQRQSIPMLEGPLETIAYRVVPWAGGWFLIGHEGTDEDRAKCEGMARVASAAGPRPVRPPTPDLICGWGVETHWLFDGRDWRRDVPVAAQPGVAVPPGTLVEFRLVAAGGPGLIALGEGAGVGGAGIYVSADGIHWRPTEPVSPFPAGSLPSGFAIGGRTISAVVEGPAAWIGSVR